MPAPSRIEDLELHINAKIPSVHLNSRSRWTNGNQIDRDSGIAPQRSSVATLQFDPRVFRLQCEV
jgi:hypothetical protein